MVTVGFTLTIAYVFADDPLDLMKSTYVCDGLTVTTRCPGPCVESAQIVFPEFPPVVYMPKEPVKLPEGTYFYVANIKVAGKTKEVQFRSFVEIMR